ncbi:MAG: terminase family protein, partial [Parvibaculaceae bacterium]|nr:terminase family protein [Parvibaculaceae bacterium]
MKTPRTSQYIQAQNYFWQGYRVSDISRKMEIKYSTVYSWMQRGEWRKAEVHQRVGATLDERLNVLIAKEDKSPRDFTEIEVLGKQLERVARIAKYSSGGNEADLNPKVKNRNKGRRRSKHKNHLDEEAVSQLRKAWRSQLFDYQKEWWKARTKYRTRNILKSRQIGATWYFAREGFMDALLSGDNQIFMSASRSQAEVFRQYIINFVREETGVELKGNPL